MTITIGLPYRNGLVLAADRELTAIDSFTTQDQKIEMLEGKGWHIAVGYADSPGLAKEFKERLIEATNNLEGYDNETLSDYQVTPETIQNTVDSILVNMGRPYTEVQLQLLLSISVVMQPDLRLVFDGKALHQLTDFTCLGGGRNALTEYLKSNLFTPSLSLEQAKNLAIYIVAQADKFAFAVRGPMDVLVLPDNSGYEWLGENEIEERKIAMEQRAAKALKNIIAPFSSPILP